MTGPAGRGACWWRSGSGLGVGVASHPVLAPPGGREGRPLDLVDGVGALAYRFARYLACVAFDCCEADVCQGLRGSKTAPRVTPPRPRPPPRCAWAFVYLGVAF